MNVFLHDIDNFILLLCIIIITIQYLCYNKIKALYTIDTFFYKKKSFIKSIKKITVSKTVKFLAKVAKKPLQIIKKKIIPKKNKKKYILSSSIIQPSGQVYIIDSVIAKLPNTTLIYDSSSIPAKWIWYCSTAASLNTSTSYQYVITYTYISCIANAKLYINCQDSCIIINNNNYIGTCNFINTNQLVINNNIFNINLTIGNNIFYFFLKKKNGYPGGLICSISDNNNNFLFNTSSLWTYLSVPTLIIPLNIKTILKNASDGNLLPIPSINSACPSPSPSPSPSPISSK